jgi:hypothetical protein
LPAGYHNFLPKSRKGRIALLTLAGLVTAAGGAIAVYKTIDYPVQRDGRETRVNVMMSVPYGALQLSARNDPKNVALVQMQSGQEDPMPFHIRYSYNPLGATGSLRMTIGSDEGMLQTNPPFAHMWKANTNVTPVNFGAIHADYGDMNPTGNTVDLMAPTPIPAAHEENDLAKVFLTKNIPISLSAQLGFGESNLDLTGLSLTCTYIETGTAKTEVHLHEMNSIPMNFCKINAGFGEFAMDGICNLNTGKFVFSGGVGYYNLSFTGTLNKDMEADVEVGMGKVSINIPPEAGRVQIMYDDSYFSSFSFNGLTKRKDGLFTSVGFENSKAPVLTLKLSSGLGKMVVNYR